MELISAITQHQENATFWKKLCIGSLLALIVLFILYLLGPLKSVVVCCHKLLIIGLILLIRWFVRFNTFRLNGWLARSGLEMELCNQFLKNTKHSVVVLSEICENIGRPNSRHQTAEIAWRQNKKAFDSLLKSCKNYETYLLIIRLKVQGSSWQVRDDLRTLLRILESASLIHNQSGEKVTIADLLRAAESIDFSQFRFQVAVF